MASGGLLLSSASGQDGRSPAHRRARPCGVAAHAGRGAPDRRARPSRCLPLPQLRGGRRVDDAHDGSYAREPQLDDLVRLARALNAHQRPLRADRRVRRDRARWRAYHQGHRPAHRLGSGERRARARGPPDSRGQGRQRRGGRRRGPLLGRARRRRDRGGPDGQGVRCRLRRCQPRRRPNALWRRSDYGGQPVHAHPDQEHDPPVRRGRPSLPAGAHPAFAILRPWTPPGGLEPTSSSRACATSRPGAKPRRHSSSSSASRACAGWD